MATGAYIPENLTALPSFTIKLIVLQKKLTKNVMCLD